jgi:hypothetical protein
MRFKGEAIKERIGDSTSNETFAYSATQNELENTISLIDNKINEKYYLFRQDILKEWVYVTTSPSQSSTN